MKVLSLVVPCYNSQEYMQGCIDSLLPGGEQVEIIIVNDGSSDRTGEIADRYAARYPGLVRVVHQENAGHGGAINAGLAKARGVYFKVVDSDDWLDPGAYRAVLEALRVRTGPESRIDMLVSNYIYDKVGAAHKRVIRYAGALPTGRVIGWEEAGHFRKGQYILMHAATFRTGLLRDSGMRLPEHTFYVDNLFVSVPLPLVRRLLYLDADLYHYFIGREDQSVQEAVMIGRIDQQIAVNRLMFQQVRYRELPQGALRRYIENYLEIVTAVTSILLIRSGTPEHLRKKEELWQYIRQCDPQTWRRLRWGAMGTAIHLPTRAGRGLAVGGYRMLQKVYNFN